MNKCNCYHEIYNKAECWGTKEREECSCSGDETKCNFYPEKRAATQARKVTEDLVKNRKYTYEETKELCKAGRESIMFDASNPIVFKNAVLVGVIVGGCVYMYLKQCESKKKKFWIAIASGIFASIITIAGFVGYGQIKRL